MSWDSLIDTVLNVMVFIFIGLLIWLYFKPDSKEEPERKG
jgi:hypothetical protein